jgi:hypothetical protein
MKLKLIGWTCPETAFPEDRVEVLLFVAGPHHRIQFVQDKIDVAEKETGGDRVICTHGWYRVEGSWHRVRGQEKLPSDIRVLAWRHASAEAAEKKFSKSSGITRHPPSDRSEGSGFSSPDRPPA